MARDCGTIGNSPKNIRRLELQSFLSQIQLTCFVVNQVVQWYNYGKTVPIFHKETGSIFDRSGSGLKVLHTHDEIYNFGLHLKDVPGDQIYS